MSEIHQVSLSPEAERNIEEAFLWIAQSNEAAAENWYEDLMAAIMTLSKFPLRYPVSPESRLGLVDVEVRQMLYGKYFWKYRVLYTVRGNHVLIAHIRHGARLRLGEETSNEE